MQQQNHLSEIATPKVREMYDKRQDQEETENPPGQMKSQSGTTEEVLSLLSGITTNASRNSSSSLPGSAPGPAMGKVITILRSNGVVTTNGNGVHKTARNKSAISSPTGKNCVNGSAGVLDCKNSRTTTPPEPDAAGAEIERKTLTNLVNGSSRSNGRDMSRLPKKIYKVVLTGGPCGGKTTGQARLCTFFENLGWKVFRVPETANILLGAGVKFSELSEDQALRFQEELLRTMIQIESVFFTLAESVKQDVLVICDRGAMDASAFILREKWEDILRRNTLNEVDIRDTRYNQIIHMVSSANGAEPFYTLNDHASRSEGLELARILDQKAAQAWVGHPYFDVVDNSTDFETKVCRMIQSVCQKLGIDARDRLQTNSRKVKFLLKSPLPPDELFPPGFQDFLVVHDYLQTSATKIQARLRKRGQKGCWSYTYTERRPEMQGQVIEVKTALAQRDYNNRLAQRDHNHVTVFKTRRCFLLNDQYFQLDIYNEPCHPRCKGLVLLETYSTLTGSELQQRLPTFLTFIREVTGDPRFSMFNLSLKECWTNNENYCASLAASEEDDSV